MFKCMFFSSSEFCGFCREFRFYGVGGFYGNLCFEVGGCECVSGGSIFFFRGLGGVFVST